MAGDVDRKINVVISGTDKLSPAAKSAAEATDKLSGSVNRAGDEIDRTEKKAKSFGESLSSLKPRGETISVVMQGIAVATGAVAGAFAAAASQSEALQGQLGLVADAGKGTLKSLGDAIASSASFQKAIGAAVQGLDEMGKWITENAGLIDKLISDGLKPLASVASLAVMAVSGLAQAVVILQSVSSGYIQMVKGFAQTVISPVVGLAGPGPGNMIAGAKAAWAGIQDAESVTSRISTLEKKTTDAIERWGRGEGTAMSPRRRGGGAGGDGPILEGSVEYQGMIGSIPTTVEQWADPMDFFPSDNSMSRPGAAPGTDWAGVAAQVQSSFGLVAQAAQELGGAFGVLSQQTISAISTMASGGGRLATGIASGDIFGIIGGAISAISGIAELFGGSERHRNLNQTPVPVAIVEDRRPKTPIVVYLSMPSGSTYGQRTLTAAATAEPY